MVHSPRHHRRSSADGNNHVENNNPSTPIELQPKLSSLRLGLLADERMTWLHTGKDAAVPQDI